MAVVEIFMPKIRRPDHLIFFLQVAYEFRNEEKKVAGAKQGVQKWLDYWLEAYLFTQF